MWENTKYYTKDKSEVGKSQIKVDGFSIVVTKYKECGDELVMHCKDLGIDTEALNETDIIKAQKKAIAIAKAKAKKILYAISKI